MQKREISYLLRGKRGPFEVRRVNMDGTAEIDLSRWALSAASGLAVGDVLEGVRVDLSETTHPDVYAGGSRTVLAIDVLESGRIEITLDAPLERALKP